MFPSIIKFIKYIKTFTKYYTWKYNLDVSYKDHGNSRNSLQTNRLTTKLIE